MNFPQSFTALGVLILATPLLAASPAERSGDLGLGGADVHMVPAVTLLPAVPTAALKLTPGPAMVLRPVQTVVMPALPATSGSAVQQLPVVGSVRRRAGDRFNTTDSSHPNDFAICYRLSQRMGLQVIPGDPTPANVKLPVSTVANNAGVTVGMTLRLGRSR